MERHLSKLKQGTPSPRPAASTPQEKSTDSWGLQAMAQYMAKIVCDDRERQASFTAPGAGRYWPVVAGAAAHHGFRVPKEPASLRRQTALDICHQEYLQLPTVLQECGLLDDNTNDLRSYAPRLAKATEELILQVVVSRKDPEDFRVIGRLAWMLLNELNGPLSIERRNHCAHRSVRTSGSSKCVTRILVDHAFPFDREALVLTTWAWMLMEDAKSDGVTTFKVHVVHASGSVLGAVFVLPQRGKCLRLMELKNMVSDFG
ncbi:hypothetical protein AaE_003594 [Aphanomyces astaci]|uniref:Uncharacterized protein n=1 Tax=Aphanomyces astaci TaxID=112090 RepID=A0A6A5ALE5_APHAT|nr:hypothetical protein AaE_003594 [Aphanomyces astaci]